MNRRFVDRYTSQNTSCGDERLMLRLVISLLFAVLTWGKVTAQVQTAIQTNAPPPAYTPAQDQPVSSDSTAASINSMDILNDSTKLSVGDRLSYRVVEEQKTPVGLLVTDSGEIEVPLLGRYAAAGKTCRQLAYELKPLLEKDFFFKATVIVGLDTLSTKPLGKVYVMGQVRAQGAIDIPSDGNLTVSRVILMDGGLADFADKRKVKLMHKKADGTTQTTIVDLVEILEKGHSEKDPIVQPGDTINVPEKLINF